MLAGRLVQVQVLEAGHYAAQQVGELRQRVAVPALRGAIYDRQGTPLAVSIPTKEVIADDFQVAQPVEEAHRLAPLLSQPAGTLAQALHRRSGYVVLSRYLSEPAAARLARADLPGITMTDSSERLAPEGDLAEAVLGGTNAQGRGDGGLEYQYQRLLAGRPGVAEELVSPLGSPIPGSGSSEGGRAGTSLELTLDEPLQFEAEAALGQAIVADQAQSGTAVVMDVRTGQILAMANLVAGPSGTVAQAPRNLAVDDLYEPGSVFKLVTFSAALQDGVITPGSTFTVPDQLQVDGTTFHDAETHPVEQMTASDILAQSSNVGTSEIALALGEQRLLGQVRRLGFGQPTDLHFPGEPGGVLATAAQWNPIDYVDLPIGQVDAATPLQVLDMMNAVADGGVLVQPKLVRATVGPAGQLRATAPSPRSRVMSTSTAKALTGMLEQVVAAGTGTSAAVPGYAVAGKTGTAQIPDPVHGGFVPGAYMATFAGFAPAEHPVLSAIVVLNRPTPIYGGTVSAPVFSTIMAYALHRYAIPTTPGAPTTPSVPAGTSQAEDVT